VYQLGRYHEAKLVHDKERFDDGVFDLEKSKNMLDNLVKNIPNEVKKTPTSK
jgi:hypothetical protein